MAINESDRFELHLGLQKILGDDMANTLMEHLPPSGWSDVARIRDIEVVERQISEVRSSIRALTAGVVTVGVALVAFQVQISLSIANL